MTAKPTALKQLDDTVSHLRNTLRKHEDVVPTSLTETICGFLSRWGRAIYEGATAIAPGREKIAEWSGCADRQAGYNLSVLRDWGFLEEVNHGQGGRHRKTVYALNIVALIGALRLLGVDLHRTLEKKLRHEARKGAMKGGTKGGSGCPLSGDKLLTPQSNNVAPYINRAGASRAQIAPPEAFLPGQEACQQVTAPENPPLDVPSRFFQPGAGVAGSCYAFLPGMGVSGTANLAPGQDHSGGSSISIMRFSNALVRRPFAEAASGIASGLSDYAASAPSAPAEAARRLTQHEADVVDPLHGQVRPWSREDWQAYFDERAGIAEYDGGLERSEAEAQAFTDCVTEWLDQRPAGVAPDRGIGVAALGAMRLTARSRPAEPTSLAPRRKVPQA